MNSFERGESENSIAMFHLEKIKSNTNNEIVKIVENTRKKINNTI